MKIVENSFILICIMTILGCANQGSSPTVSNQIVSLIDTVYIQKTDTIYSDKRNYSLIDYTKDTLIYVFDITGSEVGDTFLVTKSLWVGDSCFGEKNLENWKKARAFEPNNHNNLTHTFHISLLSNGKSVNLWNIINAEYSREVHLAEGYDEMYGKMGYSIYFLRIILKTDYETLSQISLNYNIDENLNWTFISKERIHTKKLSKSDTRKIGYCLDTYNEVYPDQDESGKNIDWNYVIDNFTWKYCD